MPTLSDIKITCPSCASGVLESGSPLNRNVTCAECKTAYPFQENVIDLVPDLSYERSISQMAMEWPPLVSIYESRFWRRSPAFTAVTRIPFDDECRTISSAANLSGHELLLDVACGSGNYSRFFADQLREGGVVGLDLSAPMLRYAGRRAQKEGYGNLAFVRASALDIPFPDAQFNAVNCCGALHLFPDTRKAIEEIYRVLLPGGRFTAAALFKKDGRISENLWARGKSLFGLTAFTIDNLQGILEQAGFTGVECHHAKGIWLIMSGKKT